MEVKSLFIIGKYLVPGLTMKGKKIKEPRGGGLKTFLFICKKCVDAWETFLFGTTDNFMFI